MIGAALFSMFFGAGNMIFPPYLGLRAGTDWPLAFLGYYLADVGLAVAAMLALARAGGSRELLRPLGKRVSECLMLLLIFCLGPLISIPRTAATTYELSVHPLWSGAGMPLFCALFFGVVALFSIRQSAVVDVVGNVLTPVLLLGLLIFIAKGTLFPLGPVDAEPVNHHMAAESIAAGYQTMDVLAAVVFGGLILDSIAQKGYREAKEKRRMAAGASLVAGGALLVVYLGLTYLGTTAQALGPVRLSRSELLVALVRELLPGTAGMALFAVVAGVACLTTAIALTSAAADWFCRLTRGMVPYSAFVVGICLFSAVISGMGVERLVELAAPVLNVVYPPVLVVVLLRLMGLGENAWVCRLSALAAVMVGLLEALGSAGLDVSMLRSLPLAELGFAWLLPAALAGAAGLLLEKNA